MINKISLEGKDAVQGAVEDLRILPPKAIRNIAQFLFNRIRSGAGRHTVTGALENSTYLRSIQQGWEVGHDPRRAPHGIFVHWGTKPHAITPKNRRALRWAANGRFSFAKRVRHPGYAGDRWLDRALEEANRTFDAIIDRTK